MSSKINAKSSPSSPMAIKASEVASSTAPATAPAAAATARSAAAAQPAADTAALIRALRNPSADIAREAATALGKMTDPAVIPALSEIVINASNYFHSVVRAAACVSLGRLGDKSATPALLKGISDEMAEASAEAVRALAILQDVRAIEPLIEVLKNERGYFLPVVRLATVSALRQFSDARATAAVQAVAANAKEDVVLRNAAAGK